MKSPHLSDWKSSHPHQYFLVSQFKSQSCFVLDLKTSGVLSIIVFDIFKFLTSRKRPHARIPQRYIGTVTCEGHHTCFSQPAPTLPVWVWNYPRRATRFWIVWTLQLCITTGHGTSQYLQPPETSCLPCRERTDIWTVQQHPRSAWGIPKLTCFPEVQWRHTMRQSHRILIWRHPWRRTTGNRTSPDQIMKMLNFEKIYVQFFYLSFSKHVSVKLRSLNCKMLSWDHKSLPYLIQTKKKFLFKYEARPVCPRSVIHRFPMCIKRQYVYPLNTG